MTSISRLEKPLDQMTDEEVLEFYRSSSLNDILPLIQKHPELAARYVAARDSAIARRQERLAVCEQPIKRQLAGLGIRVSGLHELLDRKDRYDVGIPVLLGALTKNHPPAVRETLARALARPWARGQAWVPLLKAYASEPNHERKIAADGLGALDGPKDGMAVALSEMARPSDLEVIIELISDPKNGKSRIFFVRNLSRSRSQRALEVLARLSGDPDLEKEIAHVLKGKLRRKSRSSTDFKQ